MFKKLLFAAMLFIPTLGLAQQGTVLIIDKLHPKNDAFPHLVDGVHVGVSTANFSGNLSTSDTNLQEALETLDALSGVTLSTEVVTVPGVNFVQGDLIYYNGSNWVVLSTATHTEGQVLTLSSGVPAWDDAPGAGSGEANTGENIGTGEGEIFALKDGTTIQFRTLAAGSNVTIETHTSTVTISATGGAATEAAGTSGQIQFHSTSTAGAFAADAQFYWDNVNKRLGVGTSAPNIKIHASDGGSLHANTLSGTDPFLLTSGSGQNIITSILQASSDPSQRPILQFRKARGTTAAPSALSNNDLIGSFSAGGYSGTSMIFSSQIDFEVDGSVTSTTLPQRISFLTGTTAGNRAARLVIKSNGNVGIGTTSPASELDVNGNVTASTVTITTLLSKDCLGTNGSGTLIEGTCGGGGGGTPLAVWDSNTSIDTNVSTINFTTNLVSTQSSSGNVAVFLADEITLSSVTVLTALILDYLKNEGCIGTDADGKIIVSSECGDNLGDHVFTMNADADGYELTDIGRTLYRITNSTNPRIYIPIDTLGSRGIHIDGTGDAFEPNLMRGIVIEVEGQFSRGLVVSAEGSNSRAIEATGSASISAGLTVGAEFTLSNRADIIDDGNFLTATTLGNVIAARPAVFVATTTSAGYSGTVLPNSQLILFDEDDFAVSLIDGATVFVTAIGGGGSGGGYDVEPATVAFQLNEGFTASTGTVSTFTVTNQAILPANTTIDSKGVIFNQATLQAGATAYPDYLYVGSSATVSGNFKANRILFAGDLRDSTIGSVIEFHDTSSGSGPKNTIAFFSDAFGNPKQEAARIYSSGGTNRALNFSVAGTERFRLDNFLSEANLDWPLNIINKHPLRLSNSNAIGGSATGVVSFRIKDPSSGSYSYTIQPSTFLPTGLQLVAISTSASGVVDLSYIDPATLGGGSGETNTASNIGAADGEVFAQKSGVDLEFRTLAAGSNVTIETHTSSITISASGSGGGGGYDVEPATVTFLLDEGFTATTGSFSGVTNSTSVGTIHIEADYAHSASSPAITIFNTTPFLTGTVEKNTDILFSGMTNSDGKIDYTRIRNQAYGSVGRGAEYTLSSYVWDNGTWREHYKAIPSTAAAAGAFQFNPNDIEDYKISFYGMLAPEGVHGSVGQVLSSNGQGETPSWMTIDRDTVISTFGVTVPISAASLAPTVTNGFTGGVQTGETATNKVNFDYIALSSHTTNYFQFSYSMPDGWDGSTVTFKAVWNYSNGDQGEGVVFALQGLCRGDLEDIDTAYGSVATVTDAAYILSTDTHITGNSGALTLGGTCSPGDYTVWRGYRDYEHASDTLGGDLRLMELRIHYTRDSISD